MNAPVNPNDIGHVVAADKAHVWHHLSQHKQYETIDPRVIVEGRGMRVWDAKGKEHLDAVSGGVWTVNVGYGRESIARAVYEQLLKMNYFAGAAGSVPGALFAERLIGSIRRECLDHIIVLNAAHLRRVLYAYAEYYNSDRTHLALDKDAPVQRRVEPRGRIVSRAILGGLHRRYFRIPKK